MTEYVTGQIYGWNGGECPVHPKTVVQVWLRRGGVRGASAQALVWTNDNEGHDIIAFQVIKPYAEPKTIWVNEYANGDLYAYPSENSAKTYSHTNHTRIAVKYVKAKE